LVTSVDHELEPTEAAFLRRHRYYDLGTVIAGLGQLVATMFENAPAELQFEIRSQCGITERASPLDERLALIDKARAVADSLGFDPPLVECLERYRDVNRYVHSFLWDLRSRPTKDAIYSDGELLARLREADAPGLT
jgi:hypothetical protein